MLNAKVRIDIFAVCRRRVSTLLVDELGIVYKMKRPASRVPLRFGTLVEVGLPVVVVFVAFRGRWGGRLLQTNYASSDRRGQLAVSPVDVG